MSLPSSTRSPSSALPSPPSSDDGYCSPAYPPAEAVRINEVLNAMKGAIGSLGPNFDVLRERSTQVALLGGEFEMAEQLNSLRKQMRAQEQKQIEGIEEIQMLLRNVLQNQIVGYLNQQVNKEIDDMVEQEVDRQVSIQLDKHVPQTVRDELEEHKKRLAELQCALHNSESRRANAGVRPGDVNVQLRALYRPDGYMSPFFPRDMASLLGMDVTALRQLMSDYAISQSECSTSAALERNVNEFLQFIGVPYQVMWPTRAFGCEESDVVVYPSRPGSVRLL